MCTVALFTIAKTWKQAKCPSTDEWIKKMWYICTCSLPIPLLMDIYTASVSWLLWIALQWTLGCMYLFKLWFPPDICPGVGLLEHMVAVFLVFKGTSKLFSIVDVPIYIPTNSVGGFPFLHTLSNICLYTFWWWPFWLVWHDTSL